MVSGIARRNGAFGNGCGGSALGLDTDLLEGGRDRLDPREDIVLGTCYRFDLSATDLAAEEARFGAAVGNLLQS